MSLTNWHRETTPKPKPTFNKLDSAKLDLIRLQCRLEEEEDRTLLDQTSINNLNKRIGFHKVNITELAGK